MSGPRSLGACPPRNSTRRWPSSRCVIIMLFRHMSFCRMIFLWGRHLKMPQFFMFFLFLLVFPFFSCFFQGWWRWWRWWDRVRQRPPLRRGGGGGVGTIIVASTHVIFSVITPTMILYNVALITSLLPFKEMEVAVTLIIAYNWVYSKIIIRANVPGASGY